MIKCLKSSCIALSITLFFSFSAQADDLYRQKYDPKYQAPSAQQQQGAPQVQGASGQAQPGQMPPKVEPKVEGELNSFFQNGPKRLKQIYQEKSAWLAEKTKSGERAYVVTSELIKIAQDPEIQKALLEVSSKFKFKPLLIAEVLLLILTLIFRATRSPTRSVMLRVIEQLVISNVYILLAAVVIPTAFLGTNYLYLMWNITRRVLTIFYPNLGPAGQ